MSDFKQVNVILTPQDEKSFSRKAKTGGKTRKSKRGDVSQIETEVLPPTEKQFKSTVIKEEKPVVVEQPPQVIEKPKVEQDQPKLKIKINSKRGSSTKPIMPKILPHKKKSQVVPPPTTLKKAKLIITPLMKFDPSPKSPGYKKKDSNSVKSDSGSKSGHKPIIRKKEKLHHKKKRYTERKISIEMLPYSTTRKHRSNLKTKLASMSISTIKNMLVENGVMKSIKTSLPDAMLRSMLHDFMLLRAVE